MMRLCSADGCQNPQVSKELCRKHYDRERETTRTDRKTPRRYARARAWKRAAARLIAEHRDEFDRFLAEEKAQAFEETERLHELATAAGVRPHDGIARLRPGPKAEDQEPHERLLLDPGRCPQCARTHSHGHRCQHCTADLTDWTTGDNDARLAIARRMRCVNCGKDGSRRGEPCRDVLAGRRWSRHDMRLTSASESA
jgi:hypothetical protein